MRKDLKEAVKTVLREEMKSRIDVNSVSEAVKYIIRQAMGLMKMRDENDKAAKLGSDLYDAGRQVEDSDYEPEAVLELAKTSKKTMKKLGREANALSIYPAYAFLIDALEEGEKNENE